MFYQKYGKVPSKRHTQFFKDDESLYREQVMGTKGFSGIQSILYHYHMPTEVVETSLYRDIQIQYEEQPLLMHRHFRSRQAENTSDSILNRHYVLGNQDVLIAIGNPKEATPFFRNAEGDEVYFIHRGTGRFETMFGTLYYKPGDYVVIPIGTIYRAVPDQTEQKWLIIETTSYVAPPKRYRNEFGQLLEHSPFCERDIHPPEQLVSIDEQGLFDVYTKKESRIYKHTFNHHPLDVVGWDGYLYPYRFNISDFEPITGRIHQPPPVHQTFESAQFVICSFVPRLYDYHPLAIPAPYYHSNVNSDEVLYYVEGNFMSRKGIEEESLTLHPSGIPHGPHPGKIEGSIGKKETAELAVMVDTFRPLYVVTSSSTYEDKEYMKSWLIK